MGRLTTLVPVFALLIELGDGTPLQVVAIIRLSRNETTTIFISLGYWLPFWSKIGTLKTSQFWEKDKAKGLVFGENWHCKYKSIFWDKGKAQGIIFVVA